MKKNSLPCGLFCRPEPGGFRNPANVVLAREPLQLEEVAKVILIEDRTAVVVPKWGPDVVLPQSLLRESGIIPA